VSGTRRISLTLIFDTEVRAPWNRAMLTTSKLILAAGVGAFLVVVPSSAAPHPGDKSEFVAAKVPADCATPWRDESKYVGGWHRIEHPTGSQSGRFGRLTWSKAGVRYDVRDGFVLDVCAAEDDGGGVIFFAEFSVPGPETGFERTKPYVVGYGFFKGRGVPTEVRAGS
jgi:hypothetical protein